MYFWLANAVLFLHIAVIVVLVAGLAATFTGRVPGHFSLFWCTYVATFIGVVLSQAVFQNCILTLWEKRLWDRHLAGSAYRGTFFGNYLPFISTFINRYGLGIVLAAAFIQVAVWVRAKRTLEKNAGDTAK